jgi:molybdopterin/thiamine biosynthesis adenylyltransferase
LRLIDADLVSLSNLQRQILYRAEDIGAAKVERAGAALSALNANVEIDARPVDLTRANADALLEGADLVLDGTDDFSTRFTVNAICHAMGVALISGAVGRWDGQVATFKSGLTKHLPIAQRLPCYRCFVPDIPPVAEPCSAVGIVGALTGVIGSLMALEAIKEIASAGESLAGRLLVFDGLRGASRAIALPRDPACPLCGV